jgi:hypothetical protein
MTSLINYFEDPAKNLLFIGQKTIPFGITFNSPPSDVELYLSAVGLEVCRKRIRNSEREGVE